jgi:hypothetical protein
MKWHTGCYKYLQERCQTIQKTCVIKLTDKAINAVSRFIAGSETPFAGLRIEVTDGGCSGYQYGLKLEPATLQQILPLIAAT